MLTFFKDRLVFFLIILMGALICTRPPLDPDFGWHYKYGEYIFQNQKILKENIYSYTLPDYEWANSYWLSQLILYALISGVGAVGASALLSIALALSVYFFLLKNLGTSVKLLYGAILLAMLSASYTTIRPFYFSTLFMLALIYVLRNKREYFKYLPVMFLFWANMHADFLLGLFVLGIYTLQKLYDSKNHIINKTNSLVVNFKKLINITWPLVASILATCLNPFGINLWLTLLKEMNNVTFGMIQEMSPIPLELGLEKLLTVYIAVAVVITSEYFNVKKNRSDAWLFVLVLFFFVLSSQAVYFYRVFFIIGAFSLSKAFLLLQDIIPFEKTPFHLKKAVKFSKYYFGFVVFAVALNLFVTHLTEGQTKEQQNYPVKAVEHISSVIYDGDMFNEYGWGGYLILNLPKHKTYIDGRMASWKLPDKSFLLKRYMDMEKRPYDNVQILNEDFEKYNIKWALLKKDSKLIDYLEKEKGWIKTYEDETATIVAAQAL